VNDGFCDSLPKKTGQWSDGQGLAEEVALSFRTVVSLEEGELFLRFDAFGNDTLVEVLGHSNDGAHDGRVIGIGEVSGH
jgi:hypothetical protein